MAKPSRGFPLQQYRLFIALASERGTVARLSRHDQAHFLTFKRVGRVDIHYVSPFESKFGLTTYQEYSPRNSILKIIFRRNRYEEYVLSRIRRRGAVSDHTLEQFLEYYFTRYEV